MRLTIALAVMLTLFNLSSPAEDDTKTMKTLWAAYDKATKEDRPQDRVAALEKIISEAGERHLAWDYYNAGSEYVAVKSSMDWKQREDLERQFASNLETFGEPVATVYDRLHNYRILSSGSLLEYVVLNREKLEASCNREFYTNDTRLDALDFGETIRKFAANDYEYALWCCLVGSGDAAGSGRLIDERFSGSYPFGALYGYHQIVASDKDVDGRLEEFASEYGGRAVSMFALQRLLQNRMDKLEQDNAGSAQFIEMREACNRLIRERNAFSGDEGAIASECRKPEEILKRMETKMISPSVLDDTVTVLLRNLSSVKVKVTDSKGRSLVEKTLRNNAGSYYAPDSLFLPIALPDGEYTVTCSSGKEESSCHYSRHSLSIAGRRDSQGFGIYVADYISGKPVEECDIVLVDNSGKELSRLASVKIDGFTSLPESFFPKIRSRNRYGYRIVAEYTGENGEKRLSNRLPVQYAEEIAENSSGTDIQRGLILTDRKAFNIGDTVHFKAILYSGTYGYKVAEAGSAVTVSLKDPEGKELASRELMTNEFGSVAGDFILQRSRLGGSYTISLSAGGKILDSEHVMADDYVFPSFDLSWDKSDRLYLPGDRISVSGNIKAYSGHGLGEATISYRVRSGADTVAEGFMDTDGDGNFSLAFDSSEDAVTYYIISVKVTDATGETLEFNTSEHTASVIPLSVSLDNAVKGSFNIDRRWTGNGIVNSGIAEVRIGLDGYGERGKSYPRMELNYVLKRGEETVQSGKAENLNAVFMNLPGEGAGLYTVHVEAKATSDRGKEFTATSEFDIIKAGDTDSALDCDVLGFFKEMDGEDMMLQIGSTGGPVWAVAELFGDGNILLDRQMVYLEGERGRDGSLKTVSFARKGSYPENLTVNVMYFKDKQSFSYSRKYNFKRTEEPFPLGFSRFLDTTSPGRDYIFTIRTKAGTECAVSIFDAAGETIAMNIWNTVSPTVIRNTDVYYSTSCGDNGSRYAVYGLRSRAGNYRQSLALTASVTPGIAVAEDAVVREEAPVFKAESASESAGTGGEQIRREFAGTIAWEPFLRPDGNGEADFSFRTSDKLSEYRVQLFAHDKDFNNAVLWETMLVTLPVKVAVVQPQYLYDTDRYVATVAVSNSTDNAVDGEVYIRFIDGGDPASGKVVGEGRTHIKVPAGGSGTFRLETSPESMSELGILAGFVPDDREQASDAVFVTVPVDKAVQKITEAHSAILRPSDDKDAVIRSLRESFANADGAAAPVKEISILRMLRDAVPERLKTSNEDILSLSEVLYADYLLSLVEGGDKGRLSEGERARYVSKVLDCRNSDGGFGWFPGMKSSPVITATLLERLAAMGDACPESVREGMAGAVAFLDRSFFGTGERPVWCGGISMEQYLHVRSMFPEFKADISGADSKKAVQFRKDAKEYLIPSGKRGLEGYIFGKARRLQTLKNLVEKEGGQELAESWGIEGISGNRLGNSMRKDAESIAQYAVEHPSGGIYYPNAVMPWRGLLESELYAHTMIGELLESCGYDKIAEGIRLWIMVQKETQEWGSDPAYLQALAMVMKGSESTLQTKVIAMEAETVLPFSDIKASGNGFSVEREFYRNGTRLEEGDTLHVGDKISARYNISSDENRSFVRLTVPRSASLRPVEQRSGYYGWWAKPLSVDGWISFSPQGYRSVRADRTEYWFDSYPEFKTTVTEEFFVTQEGTFQSGVPVIESLYAPHYRANGKGCEASTVIR